MKYIFLLLLIYFTSCNSKPKEPVLKKYFVVIERKELPLMGGDYENAEHVDTIRMANDSLAYWDGVMTYTANLRSTNLLKKQGVKNPSFYATGFAVLDENGNDISIRVSDSIKAQAKRFIEKKGIQ